MFTSHRLLRAGLLACVCTLILAVPAARAQAPAAPPLSAFFANPEFSGALLSPKGDYLAVRMAAKGKRDFLAVVGLEQRDIKVVAAFSDADIGKFEWVNDERLVYTAAEKDLGQGDQSHWPGLYAVDRDGDHFLQLAERDNHFVRGARSLAQRELLPWNTFLLGQPGAYDSASVYVRSPRYSGSGELESVNLLRLDTLTGRTQSLEHPANTVSWLLDSHGEPRICVTLDQAIKTVHYLDPATGKWRKLTSFNTYTGDKDGFEPLGVGPDGTLYVSSYQGHDTAAVYTYDLAANRIAAQPLIALQGYDFSGQLIMGKQRLLGVRYLTDSSGTTWFDPAMKAIQQSVDKLLPRTVNLVSARTGARWALVVAYSDAQPATYLLYDTVNHTLDTVGRSYPNINPAQMGQQDLVHYQARDGLDIPAWLTLPHGQSKNLPMVVLVHGGPYVRGGSWGFDPEAQFLASRGYAVLEPEYRGSTGFGAAHFRAGWKQWGLKMQDDIADGARWAIAKGIADGRRICIAGASYGGYATLMGLINDPDLFRCGVDWAGVTDINLMYDGHWTFYDDLPERWKHYGMPELIGDRVKDAEQLKATSPLVQAARLKQPLLLAYGGSDYRVPIFHGTKFYQAVKATNPNVEWIEYPEEGHGWALPQNRIDFWGRVEQFLARNIGPQKTDETAQK